MKKVATGEYWLGNKALELQLVDEISTSDDYLFQKSNKNDLIEVKYTTKKPLASRLSESMRGLKAASIDALEEDKSWYH